MIKNSELFFVKAKAFQDKRSEIKADYIKALKALDRYKGSAAYEEETKKAERQYAENLSAIKQEYKQILSQVLDGMENEIGRRPAKAPTSEQLNLLKLLKIKKKPTKTDFEMTANSCIDNPLALSIITEIAQENGVYKNYTALNPELDNSKAQRIVEDLRAGVADFIEYDSSRASRVAKRFYEINHGCEIELTPRRTFSDKSGCFAEFGLNEDVCAQFCKAVDGDD